jgi:hypothetical protein
MVSTPIAIIIFNRPDCTLEVLKAIAAAKPSKLFVIADGPRPSRPEDEEKCAATRALVDRFDWECDVIKDYSDKNLGCKYRPESGIDGVFRQIESAIILEDDCLPHPSFFPYCEELLEHYRTDPRVMMIGGYNFFGSTISPRQSYYFSYLGSTWGWATWRRAWLLNDPEMTKWPQALESKLFENIFPDPVHTRFWYYVYERILNGGLVDAWDYQWQLACWMNSGFRLFPETSLISNVGYRPDATHNFGQAPFENTTKEIRFPLKHPDAMVRSFEYDRLITDIFCKLEGVNSPPPPKRSLPRRIVGRLAREFGIC